MIRTASGTSRHLDRMRVSESVQNFGAPAVRWGVPRSMTTMRFNLFDAASKASSVKRDETTSDYASEIDVESSTCSVIGINNPNYEEFANLNPQIFLSEESGEDEHRGFALALNASLNERHERAHRLPDVLTQLLHLASERHSNIVCPLEERAGEAVPVHKVAPTPRHEGVVLTFGGREPIHVTAFDRPMSVWMLRL